LGQITNIHDRKRLSNSSFVLDNSKSLWMTKLILGILSLVIFISSFVFFIHLNSPGTKKFKDFGSYRNIITLIFAALAFMGWITYLSSFHPSSAFTSIISPAIFTFLTFKWSVVLLWFNL